MDTNYNYIDAYNELQQIVSEIELGEINVDEMASKISRAAQLITVCKAKLTATEAEVEGLLHQLETTDKEASINEEE